MTVGRVNKSTHVEDERSQGQLVHPVADARDGVLKSGEYTVSTSVVTIDIPAGTTGVKIVPFVNNIRFAIDEDPVAIGTNELTTGGFALAGVPEVRVIHPDTLDLRLLATADTTVWVEFYGG